MKKSRHNRRGGGLLPALALVALMASVGLAFIYRSKLANALSAAKSNSMSRDYLIDGAVQAITKDLRDMFAHPKALVLGQYQKPGYQIINYASVQSDGTNTSGTTGGSTLNSADMPHGMDPSTFVIRYSSTSDSKQIYAEMRCDRCLNSDGTLKNRGLLRGTVMLTTAQGTASQETTHLYRLTNYSDSVLGLGSGNGFELGGTPLIFGTMLGTADVSVFSEECPADVAEKAAYEANIAREYEAQFCKYAVPSKLFPNSDQPTDKAVSLNAEAVLKSLQEAWNVVEAKAAESARVEKIVALWKALDCATKIANSGIQDDIPVAPVLYSASLKVLTDDNQRGEVDTSKIELTENDQFAILTVPDNSIVFGMVEAMSQEEVQSSTYANQWEQISSITQVNISTLPPKHNRIQWNEQLHQYELLTESAEEPSEASQSSSSENLASSAIVTLGSGGSTLCSADILEANYLVAPASCVDGRAVSTIYISAGTGAGEQRLQVASTTLHPGYEPLSVNNDFAVIQLASPLNFSEMTQAMTASEWRAKQYDGIVGFLSESSGVDFEAMLNSSPAEAPADEGIFASSVVTVQVFDKTCSGNLLSKNKVILENACLQEILKAEDPNKDPHYQVEIALKKEPANTLCSGVIAGDYFLAPASCLNGYTSEDLQLTAGSADKPQTASLSTISIHPDFDEKSLKNNVAILKIATGFTYDEYSQKMTQAEFAHSDYASYYEWLKAETGSDFGFKFEAQVPTECQISDPTNEGNALRAQLEVAENEYIRLKNLYTEALAANEAEKTEVATMKSVDLSSFQCSDHKVNIRNDLERAYKDAYSQMILGKEEGVQILDLDPLCPKDQHIFIYNDQMMVYCRDGIEPPSYKGEAIQIQQRKGTILLTTKDQTWLEGYEIPSAVTVLSLGNITVSNLTTQARELKSTSDSCDLNANGKDEIDQEAAENCAALVAKALDENGEYYPPVAIAAGSVKLTLSAMPPKSWNGKGFEFFSDSDPGSSASIYQRYQDADSTAGRLSSIVQAQIITPGAISIDGSDWVWGSALTQNYLPAMYDLEQTGERMYGSAFFHGTITSGLGIHLQKTLRNEQTSECAQSGFIPVVIPNSTATKACDGDCAVGVPNPGGVTLVLLKQEESGGLGGVLAAGWGNLFRSGSSAAPARED